MHADAFLDQLETLLVPSEYRRRLVKNVPDDWRLYKKGAYVFAAVPYVTVPQGDFRNVYVKTRLRDMVLAFPFFAEKGLFLLHYGPVSDWRPHQEEHHVDKTGLRSVIMQSIHFVDPETGDNYNNRTAWGPIKFGFCSKVIAKIEELCGEIR